MVNKLIRTIKEANNMWNYVEFNFSTDYVRLCVGLSER